MVSFGLGQNTLQRYLNTKFCSLEELKYKIHSDNTGKCKCFTNVFECISKYLLILYQQKHHAF